MNTTTSLDEKQFMRDIKKYMTFSGYKKITDKKQINKESCGLIGHWSVHICTDTHLFGLYWTAIPWHKSEQDKEKSASRRDFMQLALDAYKSKVGCNNQSFKTVQSVSSS